MFLLLGMRVILRRIGSGQFRCPQEGADRAYTLKEARRFFTVFFIPLIPLGKIGNIVECGTCGSKFDERVLQGPTVQATTHVLGEALRGAVVSLLRMGELSPKAREQAVRMLAQYHSTYDEDALTNDVASLDTTTVPQQLRSLGPTLDVHAKEGILTRLTLVALGSKGALTENDRFVLDHVGEDLGLTEAHRRGVIDGVLAQTGPPQR